jgi:hypothetical protein
VEIDILQTKHLKMSIKSITFAGKQKNYGKGYNSVQEKNV